MTTTTTTKIDPYTEMMEKLRKQDKLDQLHEQLRFAHGLRRWDLLDDVIEQCGFDNISVNGVLKSD